jgi:murein L,D-transpeptidase YafK
VKRAALALLALAAGCGTPQTEPVAAPAPPPTIHVTPPPVPGGVDFVRVDKSERTLTLYGAGLPLKTYRGLQLGGEPAGPKHFEGDERTPEGHYVLDYRNPQSAYHLSLHISYPGEADRAYAARFGRSAGGEIFIHGQPNGYGGRVEGDWTDGCIALSDAEIEELWRLIPDDTPIEIDP